MRRNLQLIPATLHFLMYVRGINQAQLAQRSGINKSQLSKYLSGRSVPQLPQINRLAEGLSVTTAEFFLVTDRMLDLKKRLGRRPTDDELRAVDPVLAVVLKAAEEAEREARAAEGRDRRPSADGEGWPRKFLLAQKLAQRSNLLYLEALEECFGVGERRDDATADGGEDAAGRDDGDGGDRGGGVDGGDGDDPGLH